MCKIPIQHLKQHYQVVHESQKIRCTKCSFTCHNRAPLNSHLKFCGKLVCQTCGNSYRGTNSLEKHLSVRKCHVPTPEAAELLHNVRRKVSAPETRFERIPNRPIKPVVWKLYQHKSCQTDDQVCCKPEILLVLLILTHFHI